MELVQIYLNNCNKNTIITNFLLFSVIIFKFFLAGPGSRRENECGSLRIRIHSPDL